MNYNLVILSGNLTRDAEIHYFPNGGCVANFAVAFNKRWKDRETNEDKEKVTFVECKVFGNMAESLVEYFGKDMGKGKSVFLQGELEQENWQDKNTNENRSRLVMRVAYPQGFWRFTGPREDGGGQQQSGSYLPDDAPPNPTPNDDHIPF